MQQKKFVGFLQPKQIQLSAEEDVSQNQNYYQKQHRNKAFFTDIHEDSEKERVDKYIDGLKKKIEDAEWKQDLLISYNYVPLQTIKEKIEAETEVYQKKIRQFKAYYNKTFNDSDFTSQLQGLREFNLKLKQKMKDYEIKVEERRVQNTILSTQVESRRGKLKQLIKFNMQLNKTLVERMGVTNKQDIARIFKSQSQSKQRRNYFQNDASKNQKVKTLLKRSSSNSASSLGKNVLKNRFFQQCLLQSIKSIKRMKSSEDIQGGIYLQIMKKKLPTQLSVSKATHRSSISNTLHQRYKSKIHRSGNSHFQQDDFQMEWETFKGLNWRQLLGILLIKDKDCQKLKFAFNKSIK